MRKPPPSPPFTYAAMVAVGLVLTTLSALTLVAVLLAGVAWMRG